MLRWTILIALSALSPGYGAVVSADGAPIALHDGLVWADVDCAGAKLHFVVDTGAATGCIDLAAARRVALRLGPSVEVAGVNGRATGYRCDRFTASVGGMDLPREVVALDLSGPARGCSQRIDGLIGADFFQGKVIRIDYARGQLARQNEPAAGPTAPLRFANGVICVQVAVNGSAARWTRLDTGCTDALDWCAPAGGRHARAKSIALAWWTGSAPAAEVTVGSIDLHALPVKMRDREIFSGEAGLLGNRALSKYCLTIDGIGDRLALESMR